MDPSRGDDATGIQPDDLNDERIRPALLHHGWYPRITPYRAIFVLVTLALGTTKAVLTQQGRTIAPITLEWIASVVLTLIFFAATSYDNEFNPPRYCSWFFNFDCMDILWYLLALLSIRRPSYSSKELPVQSDTHPPITLYRLVLSLTVASFGLFKAVLGYSGNSTAATWLDWCIATILTTSLYISGLYEFNASNVFAPLFFTSRENYVTWVNAKILLLICISVSASWIGICISALVSLWFPSLLDSPSDPPENSDIFEDIFGPSIKILLSSHILLQLGLAVAALIWSVDKILPRPPEKLLLLIARAVKPIFPPNLSEFLNLLLNSHIILFKFIGAATTFVLLLTTGSLTVQLIKLFHILPVSGIFFRISLYIMLVIVVLVVCVIDLWLLGLTVFLINSMIWPFYVYRRPYPADFYRALDGYPV
ncbi:hypothetical protein GALMADRAFT_138751 [Galerina marginata CBS 339.88]|uniref:Transmembrane protein n=1 Tax=Galerina marginata (strain CBS 339.88) TaxID=685588 RepID=A0A067T3B7_GALM3|nr:hypothetical protein GALMADRAFT_138751 [Galerina marginata CBS 339.88]